MRYKKRTDIYGDERICDTRFNRYLSLDEIVDMLNELEELRE